MKRAFTLIELLVVVAIIALLAGLSFPVYQRVIQSGRAATCLANLHQLGAALNLYLGDHRLIMPTLMAGRTDKSQDVPVIDNTLNAYAPNPLVFACPADTGHYFEKTGTSYYWDNVLNGQSVTSLNFLNTTSHSAIPILSDKEGFHPYAASKVNILYADGHVTQGLHFSTP